MPPDLAEVRDPVEANDLSLSLDPGRMTRRQVADQGPDSLAQLKREVWGGGASQLAHVVDRYLASGPQAVWMLSLAHLAGPRALPLTGWGSRSESSFA